MSRELKRYYWVSLAGAYGKCRSYKPVLETIQLADMILRHA